MGGGGGLEREGEGEGGERVCDGTGQTESSDIFIIMAEPDGPPIYSTITEGNNKHTHHATHTYLNPHPEGEWVIYSTVSVVIDEFHAKKLDI